MVFAFYLLKVVFTYRNFKQRFINDYTFSISVKNISSTHSNFNFAYHFVILWLLQNDRNTNQHQKSQQRETMLYVLNSKFKKKQKLEMWKLRHFSIGRHFENWFSKKESNYIFIDELSKLHKKDTIYISLNWGKQDHAVDPF